MVVTREISIVEFGQESRFLFHHITTTCHPSKGEFIIYNKHACSSVWNKGPSNYVFHPRIKSYQHPPVSRRIRSSLQSRNIACGNRVLCSTMDSAGDLCRDAIYEVLTRSSMETVGKCRLLFKEYNKLTYESLFTKLHSQRTNIVSGFLIQSMIRNEYQISFVSTDALKTHT